MSDEVNFFPIVICDKALSLPGRIKPSGSRKNDLCLDSMLPRIVIKETYDLAMEIITMMARYNLESLKNIVKYLFGIEKELPEYEGLTITPRKMLGK